MKQFRLYVLFTAIFLVVIFKNVSGGIYSADSVQKSDKEVIKKRLSLLPLPVIGYNSDLGFQYGVLLNFFDYGEPSLYPEYKYTIYSEISRTTKGNGINQVFFDSKHILPANLRITSDLSYLTELTLNFYGFNGYDAVYQPAFEENGNPDYITRVFYRQQRKFIRFTLDLQRNIGSGKFHWLGGIGYISTDIANVNINKLNKGKDGDDILPDTTLLYDKYIKWGLISSKEADGGNTPYFKAGIIYDTRDNEPNPMKGIWSEILLFTSPKIFGNHDFSYTKLSIIHRQYFTLIKNKLSFVYRLGYQGTIAGHVPFFMQPYMINSFSKTTTTDGLGGSTTLRGIMRNRVVGDGVAFGNIELRWKFYHFIFHGSNFYLALNVFTDAGEVVQKIKLDENINIAPDVYSDYFAPGSESIHGSAGGGFRIAINQNVIIAADYGLAIDKRDGKDGLYIGLGYLF